LSFASSQDLGLQGIHCDIFVHAAKNSLDDSMVLHRTFDKKPGTVPARWGGRMPDFSVVGKKAGTIPAQQGVPASVAACWQETRDCPRAVG